MSDNVERNLKEYCPGCPTVSEVFEQLLEIKDKFGTYRMTILPVEFHFLVSNFREIGCEVIHLPSGSILVFQKDNGDNNE